MGFDNECILNIQSLPGEYFCPVCRTLIFPNEALQSQCTHLYCKPCLAYVVATTHACPYDGYLVTEADSKPLIESNKALAETIGKVQVYCLYHRSGCQWNGTLSDCINHCTGCSFGNSPVVCNRCGTQIVHRQVQEHAQTCPGLQPQGQQADNAQVQASAGQDAIQDSSAAASSVTTAATLTATATASTASAALSIPASATTPAAAAATAGAQSQTQGAAIAYPQTGLQAPTAEQWYQQQQLQYQQYYQQYPGYDPYQQQYQQYGQYQQQAYQQFPQPQMQVAPQQVILGQQQSQPFMQPQPHVQPHPQPHTQPQAQPQVQGSQPQLQPQPVPQTLSQPQPHPQSQPQPQMHAFPQPQLQTQPLSHVQFPQAQHVPVHQAQQAVQPQAQPTQVSAHPGHPQFTQLQPYSQAQQSQLHSQQHQPAVQPQQHSQPPIQHQQQLPQTQSRPMHPTQVHLQHQPQAQFQQLHMLQQPRPLPQALPQTVSQPQPLPQPQPKPQPQPQPQPQTQHPSVHGVTGHQSYPQPQAVQQIPPGASQQRPMHPQQPGVTQQAPQIQYPIHQLPQMRPPPTHMPMQAQQYPGMQPHAQTSFPNTALQPQAAVQLAPQPGQHMHHPPGMQPHLQQQQSLPQQQAQGHIPSSQLSQQGAFPSQLLPHSQHSLRPQVQSYMQSQLNVPPVQGRAGLPNQAISQQGQRSPAKPAQSDINQQSPLTRQLGSFQQSQLSHSGSQSSLAPAAPPHSGADSSQISDVADLKSAVLEKPEISVLDKASQVQQLEAEVATGNADGSEKSRSFELVNPKHDGDSKSLADSKSPNDTANEKTETKENNDDSVLNQVKGPDEAFHDGKERSNASTAVVDEVQRTEGNQNEKSVVMVDGKNAVSSSDGSNTAQPLPGKSKQVEMAEQGYATRGQSIGNAASSVQALQQLPHGQLQRDVSQLPPPQSGPVGLRGMPPAGPLLERFPPQNIPYSHPPSMADPAMVSQRPSAPDKMFPQNMPQIGSNQERRFQEPFPHQIPVHGPPTAPGQLKPPGYSENLSYPGQPPAMAEPFQPPGAKQPFTSNIPLKNIEEINPFPLQNQSYRPPPHVTGSGTGQIDPLSRPVISGPPPGAFDAPSGMMARGPNFGSEDHAGRSGPVNFMEGRGYYDGRMSELHRPLSGEHASYGQQVNSNMKMNGLSGKGPGVMHDSAFSHGVPDDRFRPLPGERFKPLPEEGFRAQAEKFGPITADHGRHIANRREFEEDFKHFPRPGHLDGDEAHRFNMYGPTGRPLDRGQQFGTDGGPRSYDRASLGSFPPYQPGGRFPPSSGVSEHGPLEIVDRQRGPLFHEDLGGKHDAVAHPERLRPFPEFGRPHFDSLPPIRSPGIPDGSRRFLMEPGHLRKEIEAYDVSHSRLRAGDHVGHGMANNVRGGEPYGARNLPGHQRFGDSVGHVPFRGGEPIGFGGYGRMPIGDSGFSNSYPLHGSVSLDVDSFEHLRKRKHGSMGWCRICKIDCDTVEGLDVHSQTKDHQNMAMEIVLSIKKENAKKQKLTSEESDETNKSRKMGFENHGSRR